MNMATEPARLIGYVSTAVTAIAALLLLLGYNMDDQLQKALIGAIVAVVVLVVFIVEMIRSRVVSPASAGQAVAVAKMEPTETNTIPEIKVANYKEAVVENLPLAVDDRTIKWKPKIANP